MTRIFQALGLCKRYGEVVVADDIGFELGLGECLGVIGPNGAGKTTLLNLLAGTVEADAGKIVLDGKDISGFASHRRVHSGIARAFQVPQPFSKLTTYENVLVAAQFGAKLKGAESQEFACQQLIRTGLADKADTQAGMLALLDRKRLELAKALACRPRVLLLDEIAGGLTEGEVDALLALILELKPHYATIWIEHIPYALKAAATRLMVLHFGKKLLEGAPVDVMDSKIVQEIYMGVSNHATA